MRPAEKRGRAEADMDESDDAFLGHEDGNASKAKKSKKTQANDKSWELSSGKNPRRVEVSEFRNTRLISIREFYEKDGAYLPGKKGIALTIEQYKVLLETLPAINTMLAELGEEVGAIQSMLDDSKTHGEPQKRVKAKREVKSNIEATSEEDVE